MTKAVDALEFRRVMGHFPTGVSVIRPRTTAAARDDGELGHVGVARARMLARLPRVRGAHRARDPVGGPLRRQHPARGPGGGLAALRQAGPGSLRGSRRDPRPPRAAILPGCLAYLVCSVDDVVRRAITTSSSGGSRTVRRARTAAARSSSSRAATARCRAWAGWVTSDLVGIHHVGLRSPISTRRSSAGRGSSASRSASATLIARSCGAPSRTTGSSSSNPTSPATTTPAGSSGPGRSANSPSTGT